MNGFAIALAMLPEHVLLVGIVTLTVIATVAPAASVRRLLAPAIVTVSVAAIVALFQWSIGFTYAAFPGHFSVDPSALAAKAIVLGLTVPVLLMARAEASK